LIYDYLKAGGPPEEILSWLDGFASDGKIENAGDYGLSRIASYAVGRLGKRNGAMVAEWIDGHREDPAFDLGKLVPSAARSWVAHDSRAAGKWLESHSQNLTDNELRSILSRWDPRDLAGCLDWIDRQVVSGNNLVSGPAISSLTKQWADQDLQAASSWVGSLPREVQGAGYAQIVSAWPEDDVASAVQWVSEHEGDEAYDEARRVFSQRSTMNDPLAALEIANGTVATESRRQVVFSVARQFYQQDPVAAEAWLAGHGHGDLLRLLQRSPKTLR
jgi:hypothetical protein